MAAFHFKRYSIRTHTILQAKRDTQTIPHTSNDPISKSGIEEESNPHFTAAMTRDTEH